MLIDTHTHLNDPIYESDLEEVIRRARDAGVERMIVVGTDYSTSQRAIELAETHSCLYAAVGVHPHDSRVFREDHMKAFYQWAEHPRVVAIGEVGLDFYRNLSPVDSQKAVLEGFLHLAKETGLPVILHVRDAFKEVETFLNRPEFQAIQGVFHCFSGDASFARRVLERGFFISFTGVVTFNKSRSVEVLREIPLERLMVETDCPYMTPEPHRKIRRNEPAFVVQVARRFAEVKGKDWTEVEDCTTQNALRLFPKMRDG